MIGLDSVTPVMIERMIAEGHMPNLQRLREQGWWAQITPTMPPTTPAGWTTIATGSWPSTHGIEGFAVHRPGDPLDRKRHSCSTEEVRAEFIWQAAERAGKRTILLKYPMSWPPLGGDLVMQVDGAGGWGGLKCVWDLAHSACWDTQALPTSPAGDTQAVGLQDWLTRDQDNLDEEQTQLLQLKPPQAWHHLPAGAEPLWETQLVLRNHGMREGTPLYLLALRLHGQDRLALASDRTDPTIMLLGDRQWSDWIRVGVPTPAGTRAGYLRIKVMEFDALARRLRLYQTQVHQEEGFTRPASIARDLLEVAGPFVEWTEAYDLLQGWIDDETQLEIYEQHVEWMSRAAQHLLRAHPWDLFMTQVHFVDMAYHLYWGAISPEHPQYNPEKGPFYWNLLGKVHRLADRFLGAVLDALDPDTCVVVLGDHGHDLYHSALLTNHLLLRQGLLALYRDRRTGEPRVNWQRTRAYALGYRVFLNVAGRDPQGIIPAEQYRAVQEEVIQALYDVRDPRTGHTPTRMAVRREDAESLGLYGETMGDVVFAMAPGYQTRSSITIPSSAWIGQHLQVDGVPILKQTQLFKEFTGEHDTSFPLTRSIRTLLCVHGPHVRQGGAVVPVRMVDIAPTICHYLQIPFPEQCEGNVIGKIFHDTTGE
jgi:predicted AlkP superfamily phosphohydrolase/phosphomutase